MDEVQPQPGDKVRVTGTVTHEGAYPGKMAIESRDNWCTDWKIEILKRADDPSLDAVGQWRAMHGMHLYRKGRKGAGTVWRDVQTGEEFSDEYVRNFPHVHVAIASVEPSTPATEASVPGCTCHCPSPNPGDHNIHCQMDPEFNPLTEPRPVPLVVQYGDPEPDRGKTFTCATGVRLECDPTGLWNGFIWRNLARYRFPLTEVIEP